jgi:hypothetical protein
MQKGRTNQLYPKLAIRLGWKGKDVLQTLYQEFGGHFGQEKRAPNAAHSEVFYWSVVGRDATTAIQVIYPWLRVKRAQAATALHAADIWASGASNRYSILRQFQELMRVLNQRGPEFALPAYGRWLLLPTFELSEGKPTLRWPETWPPSGVIQSGRAFPRQPLVPRTSVTGSGSWLTPSANEDAAGTVNGNMQRMLTHQAKESDPDGTAAGGQLNPTWVEWLMGFPPGWTDLGPSATPSSRKSSK